MTDTDEAVERAARRLWEYDNPAEPWDQALARVPVFAGQYRHKARAALAAADGGEVEAVFCDHEPWRKAMAENERLRAIVEAAKRWDEAPSTAAAAIRGAELSAALHADKEGDG